MQCNGRNDSEKGDSVRSSFVRFFSVQHEEKIEYDYGSSPFRSTDVP